MTAANNQKYWVIVPSAGIGARMQSDTPKQYLPLNGKPILSHVIDTFSAMSEIEKVVVALHAKDHWWPTLSLSHSQKVLTVIGGEKRVHSVLLGLSFLNDYASDDDWVLVHDAARPCVTADAVRRLIKEVGDHAVGGLLGLPVVDTLKQVSQQGDVQKTVSRDGLWRAQTPQMFRYGLLKQSIENALKDKQIITDEASAVEYADLQPKMVLGNVQNIKITFPEDIAIAQQFLD